MKPFKFLVIIVVALCNTLFKEANTSAIIRHTVFVNVNGSGVHQNALSQLNKYLKSPSLGHLSCCLINQCKTSLSARPGVFQISKGFWEFLASSKFLAASHEIILTVQTVSPAPRAQAKNNYSQ